MKYVGFLEFSGIELANINRQLNYVDLGVMDPRVLKGAGDDCACEVIDEGPYIHPSSDPAPWFDAASQASEEFTGMVASDIRLQPVIGRSVNERFAGGATVGKMRPRARLVSVQGYLTAITERGMRWGEKWLNDVLAGIIVGCAPDELRILGACDADEFRVLKRIGTVDGPNFGPLGRMPECFVQQVQFQVVAGNPYLYTDLVTCLDTTSIVGS